MEKTIHTSIDLKALSVTELKALAFDTFVQLENLQKTLQIINQEIVMRNKPADESKTNGEHKA